MFKTPLFSVLFSSFLCACGADKDTSDTGSDTSDDSITNTSSIHDSETISSDTTWNGSHTVNGILTINSTLTIEACSTIKMSANSSISIRDGGRLLSQGSEDCMVTFTSSSSNPDSGDWGYIELYTNGNVFDWTTIEYAGNDYASLWIDDSGSASITNSTFAYSDSGIEVVGDGSMTNFQNNTFMNMKEFIMSVTTTQVSSLNPITSIDNTNNFIIIKNSTLEENGTWKNVSVPYKTSGFSLNADVTVEAGTVFLMEEYTYILVNDSGSLVNNGTESEPILYTSASEIPQSDDWGYFDLYSNGNVFDWTIVEYAGNDYASIYCNDNSSISIRNSTFRDSNKAIEFHLGSTIHAFENNNFQRIQEYPITISPNQVASLGSLSGSDNANPGIFISYGSLTQNGLWKNLEFPYILNSFEITANLTVENGSVLKMTPYALISILNGGGLIMDGTQSAPITITSEKDTPLAGDWLEFDFFASSNNNNRFSHTNIMYGGGGGYGAVWIDDGAYLELDHVTFSHNETCDVSLYNITDMSTSNSSYSVCN